MVVVIEVTAIGHVHQQKLPALAVGANILEVVGGVQREAVRTKHLGASQFRWGIWLGGTRFERALGEEVANLALAGEKGLVKGPQVATAIQSIAALVQQGGCPSGGTAIAAVHNRQMGTAVLASQIIGVNQLGFGLHRGHHPLEFPQPQLHPQVQPGHHNGRAIEFGGGSPGMGQQGQQAFEQPHPVAKGKAIAEAQLARKAHQQLLNRTGVGRLAHQVLNGRQGAKSHP